MDECLERRRVLPSGIPPAWRGVAWRGGADGGQAHPSRARRAHLADGRGALQEAQDVLRQGRVAVLSAQAVPSCIAL